MLLGRQAGLGGGRVGDDCGRLEIHGLSGRRPFSKECCETTLLETMRQSVATKCTPYLAEAAQRIGAFGARQAVATSAPGNRLGIRYEELQTHRLNHNFGLPS